MNEQIEKYFKRTQILEKIVALLRRQPSGTISELDIARWDAKQDELGYIPEDVDNKITSITGNETTPGWYASLVAMLAYFQAKYTATNFGTFFNTTSSKTTLVDADQIGILDSVDTLFKKLSWANLKTNLRSYFEGISQIAITTSVSITTDITDANGLKQQGKNVVIENGANPVNIECLTTSDSNFNASYFKGGSSNITFTAGAGVTLVQVDGTAILGGAVGSTATLTRRNGTNTYYVRISNA